MNSKSRSDQKTRALPSKQDVLDFIQSSDEKVGKREIARAFGIKGADRIPLKALLREMTDEGLIAGSKKSLRQPSKLPSVTVVRITGRDQDGEFVAVPDNWSDEDGAPPQIIVQGKRKGPESAAGVGDRLLARIDKIDDETYAYQARPIKKLSSAPRSLLGIFRKQGSGGVIDPIDKKQLKEWRVQASDTKEAEDGELVRFEIARSRGYGVPAARVVERLGNPKDRKAISLIAIHAHGIPDQFPQAVLAEAEAATPPGPEGREDLTALPLLTIDPQDARDHDDAVYAAPDDDPKNPGGHIVIVAIADVAAYVRPGSALDREAKMRGNSVYFPDRVVPMLPERISNNLCSLVEGETRPCMAVRMVFDKDGHKRDHRFTRALMRSAASLTYQQAQAAIDGQPDDVTGPLLEPVLKPLWAAYDSLAKAREQRGPLDLDLPERKILLDDQGEIADIVSPPRLTAHKLIEEFMIAANVAAAETLEAKKVPVVYRVHDAPSEAKIASLTDFLHSLDLKLARAGVLKPAHFNRILSQSRETPSAELVAEVVLRSQAQAEYTVGNLGHFGLNLRRYAHFTSPIRRYADLLIHRALIRSLGFGEGGLSDTEMEGLDETAEAISLTERRAMAAERDTVDRLVASFLADRVGARFEAKVSGVTRSGLFVRLNDTGADGFVPASTIGEEYYYHDETHQALVGEDTGSAYQLGDRVTVRLVEAIPTAGALRFELLTEGRKLGIKRRPSSRARVARSRSGPGPSRKKKSSAAKKTAKTTSNKTGGRAKRRR
ncbi:ribonuclease R [Methyloligella sp. 2.7D]|uniref:ribonuclease R n=1 Tax=unclassified Methyloligella TaxID=2625955 RepID=UPI001FEF0D89|nr:ribonuclease R [Methyloligella sp. GL2]